MSVCLWIPFFHCVDKNPDSCLKSGPEICAEPKRRLPKALCVALLLAGGRRWRPPSAGEHGAPRILNGVPCQAPLPTEFSRQEHWSGLPFPTPGDFPKPGIKPMSLISALAGRFFTTSIT